MIKVVYFDDQSATDYLYIYDGGAKVQTSDKVKEKSSELAGKASAGLFAKLSWLPFVGGEGSAEIDAGLGYKTNSLIKTTLSNTVLTDFLERIKTDEKRIIEKIKHDNVVAYSEQYAGITESAVQSFLSDLDSYEIDNLYLQILRCK